MPASQEGRGIAQALILTLSPNVTRLGSCTRSSTFDLMSPEDIRSLAQTTAASPALWVLAWPREPRVTSSSFCHSFIFTSPQQWE